MDRTPAPTPSRRPTGAAPRQDGSTLTVDNPHTLSEPEVTHLLGTHLDQGLTDSECARRFQRVGPNAIEAAPRHSWVVIFLSQFKTLVVLLLLAASAVAFSLGETVEATAIVVVIVINTTIGFVTEWKAARALTALRAQAVAHTHVVRGGLEHRIPASELVPGDIVFLEAEAGGFSRTRGFGAQWVSVLHYRWPLSRCRFSTGCCVPYPCLPETGAWCSQGR